MRKRAYIAKTMRDGRKALNLACGTRMDWSWNNVDYSPYTRLTSRPLLARFFKLVGLLSDSRYQNLQQVDPHIICWDLGKGIPFGDTVFDVVYASHFLEHIDTHVVPDFLKECLRVLNTRGVVRIVVPDLRQIVERYSRSLQSLEEGDRGALRDHEEAINDLFEQMIRVEAVGTSRARGLSRLLEKLCRGNARRQGETHRWMYDRHTLTLRLHEAGFQDVREETASTSRIEGWTRFNLDTSTDGAEVKPGSLYVEAAKP
ncbi:MAG TPA: methyltransferase domain-containing protein [Phycisphaerae bacterium]|nr:methyltransferase domain-containing protein [Phycisphaerae bacterium]